jgi:hypothetical protein
MTRYPEPTLARTLDSTFLTPKDSHVWRAMFARSGTMPALNRNVVRVLNPDRKEAHWGKWNGAWCVSPPAGSEHSTIRF